MGRDPLKAANQALRHTYLQGSQVETAVQVPRKPGDSVTRMTSSLFKRGSCLRMVGTSGGIGHLCQGHASAQRAVKWAVRKQMNIVTSCPVFRAGLPWPSNHLVNCSFHTQIWVFSDPIARMANKICLRFQL